MILAHSFVDLDPCAVSARFVGMRIYFLVLMIVLFLFVCGLVCEEE